MYASKQLSEFKDNTEALFQPPPEGPNSGYVVINEDGAYEISCFGLISSLPRVLDLPFPQNRILMVDYTQGDNTYTERVLFVPVINFPLSANRYYVVVIKGDHKGEVYTYSEENMTTCCFGSCRVEVMPRPFDYRDIYQQIEIIPHKSGSFKAKAVAPDGYLPDMFRAEYWSLRESISESYQLGDAFGLNNAIRSNFLKHDLAANVVAGKWYCPFIFVKEDGELRDQMERSCYYELTLEQYWQEVYSGIEKMRILFRGKDIMEENGSSDGFVWFTKTKDLNTKRMGLSLALWERFIWEENRQGWDDEDTDTLVQDVMLRSYVLVERFCFKRLDGSVALALEFIRTKKVRTKN